MRLALFLLLAACGGKSTPPASAKLSAQRVGVGQAVTVEPSWAGHATFSFEVSCADCVMLPRQPDVKAQSFVVSRAARVDIATDLVDGDARHRVIDKLEVIEPDPGSLQVTCFSSMDAPLAPIACTDPKAVAFTVEARAAGASYPVMWLAGSLSEKLVDGRPLFPAEKLAAVGAR